MFLLPKRLRILTGQERVVVPGLGGDIRGTDLTHLQQQSRHVFIQRWEGLAEGHQARQDRHEEGVTLRVGQHYGETKPIRS